jgi:exopolysaccharide biosynthesis polyprenyl glycosylphosphotransferase
VQATEPFDDSAERLGGRRLPIASGVAPHTSGRHLKAYNGTAGTDDPPAEAGAAREAARPRLGWERDLTITLLAVDAAMALVAVAAAFSVRAASSWASLRLFNMGFPYWVLAVLAVPTWLAALAACGAYDRAVVGGTTLEYSRVFRAGAALLVVSCTVAFAGKVEISRTLVAVYFPALVLLAVTGRFIVRRKLHASRARGEALRRVVLVGHPFAVARVAEHFRNAPYAGYVVVGAFEPPSVAAKASSDIVIPVLGTPIALLEQLPTLDIDGVVLTGNGLLDEASLRSLAWQMHDTNIRLLVAPELTEIAGPRIVCRPAGGLPLLLVEEPRTAGAAQYAKALVERAAATIWLVAISPILVAIGVAIKLSGRGPVLHSQERLGRDGSPFTMWKFRTMTAGAERLKAALGPDPLHEGAMFKRRDDPRVTRVGRFLRRHSLDELPQLWNVVRGDMALVGPRPPFAHEVAAYEGDAYRRLMVKPGMTGLWQVNGRSDLSWAETVHLDLHYVENWSPSLDLAIIAKTVKAVITGDGAY